MKKIDLMTKVFEAFANSSASKHVYLCDMKTDISRWSKSGVEQFGLPGEVMEHAGQIWEEHIHPNDREEYHRQIMEIFEGKADAHDMVYRAMNRDGNYVVCTCKGSVITDDDGTPLYFAGTIDNHGIANEYDPITNLLSRAKLIEKMKSLKEEKIPYNILFLSLYDFSEINNVHGYDFGNKLLRLFSERLLDYTRKASIFHAGGTKFAVISSVYTEKEMEEIYHELHRYAMHEVNLDGTRIAVTLAGSYARVDNFEIDEHTVLTTGLMGLDDSIYKQHGKLTQFDSRGTELHDRLVIIGALRSSIISGYSGFYLCFQPIVSSQDDLLLGAEALLRWQKEPFGNVPPGLFIAWLENDPLFYDLSNWILRSAMTLWKEKVLPINPDLILNINLSYIQLDKPTFRNDLLNIISEVGFPEKNLCLELTERCRFMNLEFLRNEIIFLKSRGIRVALDDFGTGFSALELLINLPIDTIKIDRSFVIDIEDKKENQFVVKALLECAKNLGVRSTVEGIETIAMRNVLRDYGASTLQGYLYSKPVTIDEFIKLELKGLNS